MSTVRIAGFVAASFLLSAVGFAQSESSQTSSSTNNAIVKGHTITVVGCLMGEKDYRRAQGFGEGAFDGAGLGDEYVIVEDCSHVTNANGFRPTGSREKEMKPFLGQRVEVTGKLTDNGSASLRAESGKLPPEIRVESFGAAPVPVTAQAAIAPAPAGEPAPQLAPPLEAQNNAPAASTEKPVATSGTLPKTASDEPLIALIGLFAVGAGISLMLLRRAAA